MSILTAFKKQSEAEGEKARAELDTEILQCINKGLASFGDSVPQMILYNFKWMTKLERVDIPRKPEEFEKSLDRVFGEGSALVRKAIINEINTKFGLTQDYASLKEAFDTAAQNRFLVHNSNLS